MTGIGTNRDESVTGRIGGRIGDGDESGDESVTVHSITISATEPRPSVSARSAHFNGISKGSDDII